ncbi:hypothetical protein BH24BAC1_BH24BAC1_11430 [soil metagenome]
MKNLQPILVLIALISLISQTSYSQHVAANSRNSPTDITYNNLEDARDPGVTKTKLASSNSRLMAKFSKLFANADNQQWNTIGDYYHVSFINNGRKATAVFTSKGKMNYLITDFSLEQLPKSLRTKISGDYRGYTLLKALEITAYDTVAYQAVLENDQCFITLKYTADGIEELKEQQIIK